MMHGAAATTSSTVVVLWVLWGCSLAVDCVLYGRPWPVACGLWPVSEPTVCLVHSSKGPCLLFGARMMEEIISKQHYDAYFFDWDGLLVSTQELLYLSCKMAHQEENTRDDEKEEPLTFEEWSLFHHSSATTTQNNHRHHIHHHIKPSIQNKEQRRRRQHELYQEMLLHSPKLRLLDGVEIFLSSLDPQRVFVVTSSSREEVTLIRRWLDCAVLEAIPDSHWFTRETYQHRKPHPDGWNCAIQMAKQEQRKKALNVIGFEDTPSGVQSLLAAGDDTVETTCVLVSSFPYPDEWNDDPRVARVPRF